MSEIHQNLCKLEKNGTEGRHQQLTTKCYVIIIPLSESDLPTHKIDAATLQENIHLRVTLLSVSLINLALTLLEVTIFPSLPAKGPLFAPNKHDNVGGANGGVSTAIGTL